MSAPGTIAHYRITANLGEGGIGEVWRVEACRLQVRWPRRKGKAIEIAAAEA